MDPGVADIRFAGIRNITGVATNPAMRHPFRRYQVGGTPPTRTLE